MIQWAFFRGTELAQHMKIDKYDTLHEQIKI